MSIPMRPCPTLLLFCSACLLPLLAYAQDAAPHKKILTPDQIAFQQASELWLAQFNALRQQAQLAYKAEMAREKAGDCPNADSNLAQQQCLAHEISITQANAAAVTTAVRAMLALEHPKMLGEPLYVGPTGTPLTAAERVAEFDRLEAASAAYRKLGAQAAYDENKGGSIAPVASAEVEQRLLRSQLKELALSYENEFSSR